MAPTLKYFGRKLQVVLKREFLTGYERIIVSPPTPLSAPYQKTLADFYCLEMDSQTTVYIYIVVVVTPAAPNSREPRLRRVRGHDDLRREAQLMDGTAVEEDSLNDQETLLARMRQSRRQNNAEHQPNGPS